MPATGNGTPSAVRLNAGNRTKDGEGVDNFPFKLAALKYYTPDNVVKLLNLNNFLHRVREPGDSLCSS